LFISAFNQCFISDNGVFILHAFPRNWR